MLVCHSADGSSRSTRIRLTFIASDDSRSAADGSFARCEESSHAPAVVISATRTRSKVRVCVREAKVTQDVLKLTHTGASDGKERTDLRGAATHESMTLISSTSVALVAVGAALTVAAWSGANISVANSEPHRHFWLKPTLLIGSRWRGCAARHPLACC